MQFKELPSLLPGMRCWGANAGRFHFVILLEDGTNIKPEDHAEWKGYTASYKSFEGRGHAAIRIDGLWQNFTEAEQACRETWQQLRFAN